MPLAVGAKAPEFSLVSQNRDRISLDDLKGKKSMIVFMPYPHTRTCESEACEIRNNWAAFQGIDANVVMITTHAGATNRDWAEDNDYPFPILSDYWPHGDVSRAYDTFDETFGYAKRTTYILDSDGVIRDVIASDVLGEARPFASYLPALESIT
ncbi:MAG TPA: redoxin domain-containing protein [Acidimicrobiia bacterium]|nr:redoxin domain-containing protein [Acidimicrobiia bacterium]